MSSRSSPAGPASMLVLLALIGLPWAIADGLRAYNGPSGTPDGVLDWIWTGSNLTPPLVPFLVLIAGIVLATREGRARAVGDVLLVLVATLFVVASIGEPFVPSEADSPGFLLVIYHLALFALSIGVVVLGVRDLLTIRSGGRAQPRGGDA